MKKQIIIVGKGGAGLNIAKLVLEEININNLQDFFEVRVIPVSVNF